MLLGLLGLDKKLNANIQKRHIIQTALSSGKKTKLNKTKQNKQKTFVTHTARERETLNNFQNVLAHQIFGEVNFFESAKVFFL